MEIRGLAGSSVGFQQVRGPRCHVASPTAFLYNCRGAFVLTAQAKASQVLLREKLISVAIHSLEPFPSARESILGYRLTLIASLRWSKFQEEKPTRAHLRTDTKESRRALKVSSPWFSRAGGSIPSCTAPDLHCSPRSRGRYALLSSGTHWGRHCSGCTASCLSQMQNCCPVT